MAAGAEAPTASEYIVHHLVNFNTIGGAQKDIVDFSIINIDTVIYSVILAILMSWAMYRAAAAVRVAAPGRFIGAVEWLVEFVDEQARSIVHGDIRNIAPLGLATFVWIFLMNALDLLPVDLLPRVGAFFGLHYMRVVPTADLNAPTAMSLVVLGASLYYGLKMKGIGGFARELVSTPFGSNVFLAPFNFVLQIVEYAAKTISLSLRLFGNMFAGELIFMLIALLGASVTWWGVGLHLLTGLGWAIFHILIITIQAFIFMMLALVYIGQAHDQH